MSWQRLAARVRIPSMVLAVVLIGAGGSVGVPPLAWGGLALLAVATALYFRVGVVRAEPIPVRAPVVGSWSAINSPADKVPSHGLHAYGQSYAIDFVHAPDGPYAPDIGWSPVTRPPDEFSGFGQPVVAPADGVVVRVHDRERDHRTRASWPGLLLFFAEGFVRELGGPRRTMGNHVVLELRPGVYAVVAHLRRGSVRVRVGERVEAGAPLGECGNSGSSTEPHVHFQLMDRPGAVLAAGLPFRMEGLRRAGGGEPVPVPAAGEVVVAEGV